MSTTPTGEPLPEYPDDQRGPASAVMLLPWLRSQHPKTWGSSSVPDINDAHSLQPEQLARLGLYETTIIGEVLQALQAVGDATLVTNGTYRALLADRESLEALNAFLANGRYPAELVAAEGDAAAAAVGIITVLQAEVERLTRLLTQPSPVPVVGDGSGSSPAR